MRSVPLAARLLAATAAIDWLIGRTLLRAAIFAPKPAGVSAILEGASLAARVAANAAGLLALGVAAHWAWQAHRQRRTALGLALATLVALGVLSLVTIDRGWLSVAYHAAAGVALLAAYLSAFGWPPRVSLAAGLPGLAVLSGIAALLSGAVAVATGASGWSPLAAALLRAGEALALLGAGAIAWKWARHATRRDWILAGTTAAILGGLSVGAPSMAGVLAIWSTGFSWFLPWPLYAAAVWLVGATALAPGRTRSVSAALVLLCAGGLAPQMSTHLLFSLIGLRLLFDAAAADGMPQAVTAAPPAGREISATGLREEAATP